MNIPTPNQYFGKKIKIYSPDGTVTEGDFLGYDYDYNEDGTEFLEFDIVSLSGIAYSFTEDEIDRIEVIGDRE